MPPYVKNNCSYKNMGDATPIFTTNENQLLLTTTTANDNSTASGSDSGGSSTGQGSGFPPLAPTTPQEPLVGDTGSRTESVASPTPASGNTSTDNNNSNKNLNNNKKSLIEICLKTFVLPNTYEQSLKDIRPALNEFLHEFIRFRSEKGMKQALPNECAFCKNNGESAESYSSHALKDSEGRVQCPALRALRCPRCGATGDQAHTVKYCPAHDHGQGTSMRRGRNSFWLGKSPQDNNETASPSFSAQSNLAQSNPAQSNAAQSNPAQSNAAQSNAAQSNAAQSNAAQSNPAQ